MKKLEITVFDVEHGSCSFIKSPNGYGIVIDCGRSQNLSPIHFLAQTVLPYCKPYMGCLLSCLIVSHPHNDHIQDISRLISYCRPGILVRQPYDWSKLEEASGNYENLDQYRRLEQGYTAPVLIAPDFGCEIVTSFGVSPDRAWQLNPAKFVNNSSIPVIISYCGYKIVLAGDLEEEGWTELLCEQSFRAALSGTNILVASHHGHKSGFCSQALTAMGYPDVVLVSAGDGDQHVDSQYSSPQFVRGINVGDRFRRMLSTRQDGSVIIQISENGGAFIATANSAGHIPCRWQRHYRPGTLLTQALNQMVYS